MPMAVRVTVCFYSYFKDLTGCPEATEEMREGSTLGELFQKIEGRFPRLAAMRKSALMAVGLDYQGRDYFGDSAPLFPRGQSFPDLGRLTAYGLS